MGASYLGLHVYQHAARVAGRGGVARRLAEKGITGRAAAGPPGGKLLRGRAVEGARHLAAALAEPDGDPCHVRPEECRRENCLALP